VKAVYFYGINFKFYLFIYLFIYNEYRARVHRNKKLISIDEIDERYRLNHAIIVQAVCQAVVCGTMCLQAAFLQNTPRLTS